MSYDIDYLTYESIYPDDDFSVDDYCVGYDFHAFQANNPTYLENLRNRIDVLYKTYSALSTSRYAKLRANPALEEAANLLGFGLLMRHALEAISIDLVVRACLDVGGKSAYERLKALEGQTISGYAREQEKMLSRTLDKTNEIAHPHIIGQLPTYKSLVDFYNTTFRPLIDFHMALTARRDIRQYLKAMQKRMDNFRLNDSITRILTLGNLIRQLTECSTNLWCYSNSIVPTDASSAANQISLSQVLGRLGRIAKEKRDNGFGTSSMTSEMIDNLFRLKNTSNALMHVTSDRINLFDIRKNGRKIRGVRAEVTTECSPDALAMKIDASVQKKTGLILTLLCGFFGWFGVHHFYAGNILKGIFFLLTFGCASIGPIFSLISICSGGFRTKKWGVLNKARPGVIALAILFIVLHIALLILTLSK